jgi:hypothetical protein
MSMVNLARSPEETKGDMPQTAVMASKPTVPEYPYGCCISLDDECLKKMALDGDLPQAGEMIHFEAMAKVTCASVRDEVDAAGNATQCRRVELQITDMGMLSPSEQKPRKWYGDGPSGDE